MSRFKWKIRDVRMDGKVYWIDAELAPALKYVPAELLKPLLTVLDRDMRTRYKAWRMADDRVTAWKLPWVDRGVALRRQGQSFANIGRILHEKGYGSADRIARTLSAMYKRGRGGRESMKWSDGTPVFRSSKKSM